MQFFNSELCGRCKGKGLCGGPCKIIARIKGFAPKRKLHFSGSTPPEIFVGRHNYPEINAGVLSPEIYGNTKEISMPEIWHSKRMSIEEILSKRISLVYSKFKTPVKGNASKFVETMQEIGLADKPFSAEIFLEKVPKVSINIDSHVPLIGNPAPLKTIRLEENPHVHKKVDYLSGDIHTKADIAVRELYKSNIAVSSIIKVFSAGMLGLKKNRKLVPTRWSVTAVDDTLSKMLLDKIRHYQEISEILVFNSEYLGNHYEFLLLPDKFSFEVIEAKMPGSVWNPFSQEINFYSDYEGFFGRKEYASNVTGAYYVNRLALAEYLEKMQRQASCLVLREVRQEYYAPLGVGILRQASREAFKGVPERFSTIQEAFEKMQTRMKLPVSLFGEKSALLKNHGKQARLCKWL